MVIKNHRKSTYIREQKLTVNVTYGLPKKSVLVRSLPSQERVRSVETFGPQIERTSIHSAASDDSFVIG